MCSPSKDYTGVEYVPHVREGVRAVVFFGHSIALNADVVAKLIKDKMLHYEYLVYERMVPRLLEQVPFFVPAIGLRVCSSDPDHFESVIQMVRYENALALADFEGSLIDKWKLFFQVCIALLVLGVARGMHNDLHLHNVLVRRLRAPTTYTFVVNRIRYTFTSSFEARIFDWDFAYFEELGNNPQLDFRRSCAQKNICNKFARGKDFVKFACKFMQKVTREEYERMFALIPHLVPLLLRAQAETVGCRFRAPDSVLSYDEIDLLKVVHLLGSNPLIAQHDRVEVGVDLAHSYIYGPRRSLESARTAYFEAFRHNAATVFAGYMKEKSNEEVAESIHLVQEVLLSYYNNRLLHMQEHIAPKDRAQFLRDENAVLQARRREIFYPPIVRLLSGPKEGSEARGACGLGCLGDGPLPPALRSYISGYMQTFHSRDPIVTLKTDFLLPVPLNFPARRARAAVRAEYIRARGALSKASDVLRAAYEAEDAANDPAIYAAAKQARKDAQSSLRSVQVALDDLRKDLFEDVEGAAGWARDVEEAFRTGVPKILTHAPVLYLIPEDTVLAYALIDGKEEFIGRRVPEHEGEWEHELLDELGHPLGKRILLDVDLAPPPAPSPPRSLRPPPRAPRARPPPPRRSARLAKKARR